MARNSNNQNNRDRTPSLAWLVFECAFCKTKVYVGQGGADVRAMYEEIDVLMRDGCRKCGGRMVFKERGTK